MSRAAFIYEPVLSTHVLRSDHVFRPSQLQYTLQLLEAYGAFHNSSSLLVAPRPASKDELLSFHTAEYPEAVQELS